MYQIVITVYHKFCRKRSRIAISDVRSYRQIRIIVKFFPIDKFLIISSDKVMVFRFLRIQFLLF